jgi:hypothetical protein
VDQCRLAEELKERTAPELLYVESKFAALMSYRLTADVGVLGVTEHNAELGIS